MSELQIAWLELVTVGGVGAILALSGVGPMSRFSTS